ncbi:response regulator receiver modulated diguanylate cyclase [Sulfitobacter brevis]|uniref:diguanylate cyclase n=1 Tax=Sulfitobacter brevis TaxID=74348 RepID=A0A1I2ANK7_9RHOB|nr:diguanylate cyclase [Sulfitobacter brevis]SFE45551.1 response regulator receiver modulated diguanylate cyclase [Sulfitobacter brevis]
MQGKILIVDGITTNRIALKVKLACAYYSVIQATSLAEAVTSARKSPPDLIITSLTLPDGSAADLCRRLSASIKTASLPVLAIGPDPSEETRIATLAAGAEDVMHTPIDDLLLLGRIRSLIRAHNTALEWHMRDDTSRALGLSEPAAEFGPAGSCCLIGPDLGKLKAWAITLRPLIHLKLTQALPEHAGKRSDASTPPDIYVLVVPGEPEKDAATLRLISALRASPHTRHAGILVLQTKTDPALAANALDLGADDLMTDGFAPAELALRLKAMLRRKRMGEQLRATVRTGLRAAISDPLTGLHNRRYAMPHLARIAEHAQTTGRPYAVMVADLDHFKRINDDYGHAAGDAVLIEVAARLRGALRAVDMVARIGGEEFMIVMPGTTPKTAQTIAIRLCNSIGHDAFKLPGRIGAINVTVSIGMAISHQLTTARHAHDLSGVTLLAEADKALYSAKVHGRNRVTFGRPAA